MIALKTSERTGGRLWLVRDSTAAGGLPFQPPVIRRRASPTRPDALPGPSRLTEVAPVEPVSGRATQDAPPSVAAEIATPEPDLRWLGKLICLTTALSTASTLLWVVL